MSEETYLQFKLLKAEAVDEIRQDLEDATSAIRDEAEAARDEAVFAAESSGDIRFFSTFADADAATLDEGQVVEVFADETRDGARSRYQVENGSLVFRFELLTGPAEVQQDEVIVELGGDFDPGVEMKFVKTGSTVTAATLVTFPGHTNNYFVSAFGAIPVAFRPLADISTVITTVVGGTTTVSLTDDGAIFVYHNDWSGQDVSRTSIHGFSVAYLV